MSRRSMIDFMLLAALWGASFLFMRVAAREFGAMATAGLRVGIAALFLLPILLWRGQWPAFRARAGTIMLVGLLNSGLPFALFSWALLSITTGLASIVNAMVPMFGAVVAWVWLKDGLDRWRVLGLVLGFAGVATLAWQTPGGASFKPGGSGWAVAACLGACLCYAIAASATKKYLTGIAPMAIATGSQMGATVGLLVPMVLLWPAARPSAMAWAAVAAVAILCTGIAYILYFRLIATAGPARALAVTFLVPVFALIYGLLALDEHVSGAMLVCGAVIVLGTALSTGLLKPRQAHRVGSGRAG
ncbi:MAG: DMT family transporter [Comamonadaceae bacterium]|nr:MAG: DMT family transporter [Comamonadaceae bacterium]